MSASVPSTSAPSITANKQNKTSKVKTKATLATDPIEFEKENLKIERDACRLKLLDNDDTIRVMKEQLNILSTRCKLFEKKRNDDAFKNMNESNAKNPDIVSNQPSAASSIQPPPSGTPTPLESLISLEVLKAAKSLSSTDSKTSSTTPEIALLLKNMELKMSAQFEALKADFKLTISSFLPARDPFVPYTTPPAPPLAPSPTPTVAPPSTSGVSSPAPAMFSIPPPPIKISRSISVQTETTKTLGRSASVQTETIKTSTRSASVQTITYSTSSPPPPEKSSVKPATAHRRTPYLNLQKPKHSPLLETPSLFKKTGSFAPLSNDFYSSFGPNISSKAMKIRQANLDKKVKLNSDIKNKKEKHNKNKPVPHPHNHSSTEEQATSTAGASSAGSSSNTTSPVIPLAGASTTNNPAPDTPNPDSPIADPDTTEAEPPNTDTSQTDIPRAQTSESEADINELFDSSDVTDIFGDPHSKPDKSSYISFSDLNC